MNYRSLMHVSILCAKLLRIQYVKPTQIAISSSLTWITYAAKRKAGLLLFEAMCPRLPGGEALGKQEFKSQQTEYLGASIIRFKWKRRKIHNVSNWSIVPLLPRQRFQAISQHVSGCSKAVPVSVWVRFADENAEIAGTLSAWRGLLHPPCLWRGCFRRVPRERRACLQYASFNHNQLQYI